MRPEQVLPLLVRVDMLVIAMKSYATLLKDRASPPDAV